MARDEGRDEAVLLAQHWKKLSAQHERPWDYLRELLRFDGRIWFYDSEDVQSAFDRSDLIERLPNEF
jgi:hypothetical protein